MKLTFTREEMREKWRRIRAVEPMRLDGVVSRTDGPDVDAIMEAEMRAWYLDLLDHGPLSALCLVNKASEAKMEARVTGEPVIVTPPSGTRRVTALRFSSWPMAIAPSATPEAVMAAVSSAMWKRPLAAILPDGTVAVAGAAGTLKTLTVAFDEGPETYKFDDSAWKEPTF